jgi:hypothetical protein
VVAELLARSRANAATSASRRSSMDHGTATTSAAAAAMSAGWQCGSCTLVNVDAALACAACSTARPLPSVVRALVRPPRYGATAGAGAMPAAEEEQGDTLAALFARLEDALTCIVCCEAMRDPITLPCCGSAFCGRCIHEWMGNKVSLQVDLLAF